MSVTSNSIARFFSLLLPKLRNRNFSPTGICDEHARIQEFLSGGGPGQSDKKSSDIFFIFFSPQLIVQKSNGQFQRILSFFKVPEGVQHFPGGVQLLPGGV